MVLTIQLLYNLPSCGNHELCWLDRYGLGHLALYLLHRELDHFVVACWTWGMGTVHAAKEVFDGRNV